MPTTDPTKLPWPCRHAVFACMDSETRSAWRLVSKQACHDVYETTRSLRWRRQQERWTDMAARMRGNPPPPPSPDTLPAALLAKCPNLRQLHCDRVSALRSIYGLPPGLEVLVYSNASITDYNPLSLCPSLRELSVSFCDSVPDCAALSPCTALVKLELHCNYHGDQYAPQIAQALGSLPALEHLCLSSNSFNLGAANALAPSLKKLSRLRHLDLMDNDLGSDAIIALCPAIQVRGVGRAGGTLTR